MTTTAELQRRTLRVLVGAQVLSRCGPRGRHHGGRSARPGHARQHQPGGSPQRPVHRGERSRRGGRRAGSRSRTGGGPASPPATPWARWAARAWCSQQCSTARCCCSSRCSSTARAAPPTSRRGTPAPTSPTRATAPARSRRCWWRPPWAASSVRCWPRPTGHLAHMVGVPRPGRAVPPGHRRVRRRGGRPRDEAAPRPAPPRARAGGGRGGAQRPRSPVRCRQRPRPRSATASSSAPS